MMDEKRFYDEKPETKQMTLVCPHCREEGTFPVRSYMVRMDDLVACRNMRCRKRFDLTGQTVIIL